MDEQNIFIVIAKSPILECKPKDFTAYITTTEGFEAFTAGVINLSALEDKHIPLELTQILRAFEKAEVIDYTLFEDRAIQGIVREIETCKGKVEVGFTRVREHRIYVMSRGKYYRGVKAFLGDFCLIQSTEYIPLDKTLGDGNIDILDWTKRKSVKGMKFVHNRVENLLYVVDMIFKSLEEMKKDMKDPKDINLAILIESLL